MRAPGLEEHQTTRTQFRKDQRLGDSGKFRAHVCMHRATYPIEVLTVMVEEMTVFEVQLFDQRACVRQRSEG